MWICAERFSHTAYLRVFVLELGRRDEWDRCDARGFSCALLPGWGGGGRGRRRWMLRFRRPDRHRTGGSEGAHVHRDLCVVFGGGCACVTWAQECACVHYRMEWCVRAGHADIGVRLLREWGVCVCVCLCVS